MDLRRTGFEGTDANVAARRSETRRPAFGGPVASAFGTSDKRAAKDCEEVDDRGDPSGAGLADDSRLDALEIGDACADDSHPQGYEIVIPRSQRGIGIEGEEERDCADGGDVASAAVVVVPSRANRNRVAAKGERRHRQRQRGHPPPPPPLSSSSRGLDNDDVVVETEVTAVQSEKRTSKAQRKAGERVRAREQLPSPGHVYALREIVNACSSRRGAPIGDSNNRNNRNNHDSSNNDNNNSNNSMRNREEEKVEEGSKNYTAIIVAAAPSHRRIVTSKIVRTTERIHRRLEEGTAGAVLCASPEEADDCVNDKGGGGGSKNGAGQFYAVEPSPNSNEDVDDDGDDDSIRDSRGRRRDRPSCIHAVAGATVRRLTEGVVPAIIPRDRGEGEDATEDDGAEQQRRSPASPDDNDARSEKERRRKEKKKTRRRKKEKKWFATGRGLYGYVKRRLGGRNSGRESKGSGRREGSEGDEEDNDDSDRQDSDTGTDARDAAARQQRRARTIDRENGRAAPAAAGYYVDDRGRATATARTAPRATSSSSSSSIIHGHGMLGALLSGSGAAVFGDGAVIRNRADPIDEVVCVDRSLGIYVSESGLSAADCRLVVGVAESCASARGGWSSYTYAKQTLGCRENDPLAFASAGPVMTACATIRKHLAANDDDDDEGREACERDRDGGDGDGGENDAVAAGPAANDDNDDDLPRQHRRRRRTEPKELVLDVREPHVVKYDTSRMERQKLDMHTDKSEWTFLIALSEGRGEDYGGGGTYFQALNSTVHLQRGQMLIFRGKLRHCGVRIVDGSRYLLVGFLVPQAKTSPKGGGRGGVAI